jgi:hypothetical protein
LHEELSSDAILGQIKWTLISDPAINIPTANKGTTGTSPDRAAQVLDANWHASGPPKGTFQTWANQWTFQ